MPDYTPPFSPGHAITCSAASPITAGHLVTINDDRTVTTGQPGDTFLGVAGMDTKEGESLLVHLGGVHRLTASAPITAGDRVAIAINGTIAPTEENSIGLALTGAGIDETAQIKLH